MTRPNDSKLQLHELLAVEERARKLLDRASAGSLPTPVEDILGAARLTVAPRGFFDPRRILDFAKNRARDAQGFLKNAISVGYGPIRHRRKRHPHRRQRSGQQTDLP